MLHSHNAIAGDLHASAQLARLSIRVGGLSSTQFLPISRILELEKRLWSREYSSATRSTINICQSRHVLLDVGSKRPLPNELRGDAGTEATHAPLRWTGHGHSTSQHLRFFSHRPSGYRAPLPRGGPTRDSSQPARMNSPAFAPQKPRKGASRASILRGPPASITVLRGIQSPDAERERQERESKEEEIKRKAKEAREERERQQRLDKQEKEYDAKVTQPLNRWQEQLEQLSSELPSPLGEYMYNTRVRARRSWHQQYVEQCERPIASFVVELDRIEALLQSFAANAAHTLTQTVSDAKAGWPQHRMQLLEKELDSFSEGLAELERDLYIHENNIRALQKAIRTLMPQLTDEHKQLKETGLHNKSRLLANRYMFGMADVLRCLNDAALINVRQELIERQQWTIVDRGVPMPRSVWVESLSMKLTKKTNMSHEPAFHSGVDSNLVRGARDPKKVEALLGLFVSRLSLEHNAAATSRLLHIWRQHDTDLRRLRTLPYLFSHYSAYSKFNHLRNLYTEEHIGAIVEHKVFGALLFLREAKPNRRWKRMAETLTRMLDSRDDIEALMSETFCSGMSYLLLTPTSILERSLITMYRPFYTSLGSFVQLMRLVGWCYEGSRKLQCSPQQRNVLKRLIDSLEEDIIEMTSTLRDAVPQSGATALHNGTIYSPQPRPHSATAVANESNTTALKLAAYVAPVMSVDSLLTCSFYTERKAVSVSYILDDEDVRSAIQGLASSDTLALGAIVMNYIDGYNIRSSRIRFILLASADNVVICHSGLWHILGTDMSDLGAILENPRITKVGVNMDFLRRQFSHEYNWEIQGVVNLAGNADPVLTPDSQSDPSQVLLAHLARQRLSMDVPATIDAKALLSDGMEDPLAYFRHLASHAYLPLLLHGATQGSQEGHSVKTKMPSDSIVSPSGQHVAVSKPRTELVEFGSIFIGPQTSVRSTFTRELRVSKSRNSRAEYLGKVTKQLAKVVLQKGEVKPKDTSPTCLKYLQAYYLLTTFGESLRFVTHLLRVDSIGDLYGGVLWVAKDFRLPLYDGHRGRLEVEARSLGARRIIVKRTVRSTVHQSLSSDKPVTLSTISPGRPDSIGVEAVPKEDPRITKAIPSSTSKNEPKLLAEEKGRTKNARQHERRRLKRRELRRTDASFRAAERIRGEERRRRREARRNEELRATGEGAGTPAVVVSSSTDEGSTGHPEDATIPWASFGMRDAAQNTKATSASVTPSKPRRADAIRGTGHAATRKGRSQPLKQAGGGKTRLQTPGSVKVVKVPSLPRKVRRLRELTLVDQSRNTAVFKEEPGSDGTV